VKFVYTDNKTLPCFGISYEPVHFANSTLQIFCNLDKKIFFVIMPLTQTFVWKNFSDYMIHSTTLDSECLFGENHNEWLYTIWNNKSWFLKETVELTKDFHHFCNAYYWTDIGSIRCKPTPEIHKIISSLSFVNRESKKMMFMQILKFEEFDFEMVDNVPIIFHNNAVVNRIEGGFFGGGAQEIEDWCNLFFEEICLFRKLNLFGGKDQYMMSSAIMKNYHNLQIYESKIYNDQQKFLADLLSLNNWFYYICIFSG